MLLFEIAGGGKLELWSPESGGCVQSAIGHEDAISVVQVMSSSTAKCNVNLFVAEHMSVSQFATVKVIFCISRASKLIDLHNY